MSPPLPAACSVRPALLVSDPDAVVRSATDAGATEVVSVSDQDYGYRLRPSVDPFGHHWEIARPLHG